MAFTNTAARMNKREDVMRNPKQGSTTKLAKGKPAVKLVVAIGPAPTLGSKQGRAYNKNAGKIKK